MNQLNWLRHPAVNFSEMARRVGIPQPTFAHKLNNDLKRPGIQARYEFTPDELAAIERERLRLIDELTNNIFSEKSPQPNE